MSNLLDDFAKTLRQAGYSVTNARRTVFVALGTGAPKTMHQLVADCSGKIDRASVYRTVMLFEQLGIVQRLQIGWKYKLELSDKFSHHHHHISCIKCGKTVETKHDGVLEDRIKNMASTMGFTIQSHQLDIAGTCGDCR